jgi:hypothetical protein
MQRDHILGLSVAVARGGRALKARGYGFESLEHRSLPRSISCTSSTTTTRLVSTVEDLVRFDVALRTGRPLKSSTTSLIERPGKLNANLMIARNGAARSTIAGSVPDIVPVRSQDRASRANGSQDTRSTKFLRHLDLLGKTTMAERLTDV